MGREVCTEEARIGGYHIGKIGTIREAVRLVHEAIDAGVNFLDNAWEYHDGVSEERMGRPLRTAATVCSS